MAFSGEYMVPIEDAQKLERELAEMTKQIDPYEREAAKAAINALKRELARVTEQRDGAFSLIQYVGELLGITPQEHKSAHGFKVLQGIKDLIEQAKGGSHE
jgi:uncharacterized protein YydD (DUF2326 family)